MPGMGGLAAARVLQAQKGAPYMVAVSGHPAQGGTATPEIRNRKLAVGGAPPPTPNPHLGVRVPTTDSFNTRVTATPDGWVGGVLKTIGWGVWAQETVPRLVGSLSELSMVSTASPPPRPALPPERRSASTACRPAWQSSCLSRSTSTTWPACCARWPSGVRGAPRIESFTPARITHPRVMKPPPMETKFFLQQNFPLPCLALVMEWNKKLNKEQGFRFQKAPPVD